MTEDHLLRAVLDISRLFGVLASHFRPALSQSGKWHTAVAGDGKGFPDLTLVGVEVAFRELKSERGVLRPEQKLWISRLESAGANVGVWRPQDLESGRIETELRTLRGHIASANRKSAWLK